jgi:LacI family transcriptional regulator
MPTLKDVAALAGVSYTTVSHVINHTRPIAPETRAKVEDAIKKIGYSLNVVARGLRRGESKTFGVVSMSGSDPFFAQILRGIQEKAWEEVFGVYIAFSDLTETFALDRSLWNEKLFYGKERGIIDDLSNRDIQGLVLNSLLPDALLMEALDALRIPCILFQRLVRGPGWDTFVCDDYQGSTEAMAHLIGLGHERIGLIEGESQETHTVKFRKKAWEDALRAHGIAPDGSLVRNARYDIDEAYHATKALLAHKDPPTAILYCSDVMALAGIRAAADLGISVPGDLSLIGYDDLSFGRTSVPRLCSVSQDALRIGRDMMERLIARVARPGLEPEFRCYPQNLVIRESTGPAKTVPSSR